MTSPVSEATDDFSTDEDLAGRVEQVGAPIEPMPESGQSETTTAQTLADRLPAELWPVRSFSSTALSLGIAIISAVFVLLQLRPDLLLSDNTPSGGDMGAHVWGPAYMRDHLLPEGRLTGWTPDWYAGFPAYHFYMVVPALAIIAMNNGLPFYLGIPVAAGLLFAASRVVRTHADKRALIWIAAGIMTVLLIGMPYGIAFKLVSVAGLVSFPLMAWGMGRLAGCLEPVPALLSLGSVIFLFDTNFTIYGGNIASTLAGEFAFSLSLSLSLLAIGLVVRSMDTGGSRASSAVVIALVALCHVIPLFFMVTALIVLVLMQAETPRSWLMAVGVTLALIPVGAGEGSNTVSAVAAVVSFLVVFGSIALADTEVRRRFVWLAIVGPVAALLSAFWLVPFYLREPYFNDMGWERLVEIQPALLTTPMRVLLPIAAIGAVLAFAIRDRMGMLFTILAVTSASGVANLPAGKLWNARLLPFYYLSVYFLSAVAIALVVRFAAVAVSERYDAPDRRVMLGAPVGALLVAIVAVALPLRILPFGGVQDDGVYRWLGLESNEASFVPSWIAWNYSGYEDKRSYREYSEIVTAMDDLGQTNGCGRAMWEYDKGLDRYGTPMALMLLPHWTDGCIGSMEGLYFESSATTPFHFLHQSTLSESPSRAQRDLPYRGFDLDTGVAQLQVMGVRYYMAQSDTAIAGAKDHPDLTEVLESQPWVVFEVTGSETVVGLDTEPVVAEGLTEDDAGDLATRFDLGWVSQAVLAYNDPNIYQALPAEDGPAEWQRITTLLPSDGRTIEPAVVSNIDQGTNTISFDVDQVGKPVMVKTSYFPNWQADGADGPWRIGPNMMVVVPTSEQVKLSYGYTGPDYLGYLLTLAGLAALVMLSFGRLSGRRFATTEAEPQPSQHPPPVDGPEPPTEIARDGPADAPNDHLT